MPLELVKVTAGHFAQVEAQAKARNLGVALDQVGQDEIDRFNRFINRVLAFHTKERRWMDLHLGHIGDYILALGVAKRQFGSVKYGGAIPSGGEFGSDIWRAGYTGVGYHWATQGASSAATTATNWIHAGGTLLSGSNGNDVRYLESFVGVITGMGDLRKYYYGPSDLDCFQIRLDNRILKPISPWLAGHFSDFPVVELDESILVKDRTQLRFQYMSYQATTAVPFLTGLVYGMEGSVNKIDSADLDGASNKLYEAT